jgi:regulatory protein SWI6
MCLSRIPLDRGRDVAAQFGVAHLLTPLFDYMPTASNLPSFPTLPALAPARPPSGSPGFHSSYMGYYPNQQSPSQSQQQQLGPPPILPGSALKLLNQGRAQGLFTPSSSAFNPYGQRPTQTPPTRQPGSSGLQSPAPVSSQNFATSSNLKRPRQSDSRRPSSAQSQDVDMRDATPGSSSGQRSVINGERDGLPSPSKRARVDPGSSFKSNTPQSFSQGSTSNGNVQSQSDTIPVVEDGPDMHLIRMADKPSSSGSSNNDRLAPLRNAKRTALLSAIHQQADTHAVLNLMLNNHDPASGPQAAEMDLVVDDQGHTPLHLAASLARDTLAQLLVQHGANPCTGNHAGETPLIRAVLSMHCFQSQTFPTLVALLHTSIRTLDGSRKTVLHHISHIAGVKGRAAAARYYMEGILIWVAEHQGGDFKSLVDIQDIHGDTALNIAARVGNRSLVKTLIDCGANRTLGNKLGLRPGDFGLEGDVRDIPICSRAFLNDDCCRIRCNSSHVPKTFWHNYGLHHPCLHRRAKMSLPVRRLVRVSSFCSYSKPRRHDDNDQYLKHRIFIRDQVETRRARCYSDAASYLDALSRGPATTDTKLAGQMWRARPIASTNA